MDHSQYREEIPHGDHPLSYDHSEPGYRMIAIYMSVTVVLLIFIGIAVQGYYELTYTQDEYNRVLSQENWALRDLHNKERWELTHYGYIDKSKGISSHSDRRSDEIGGSGRGCERAEVSDHRVSSKDSRKNWRRAEALFRNRAQRQ